MNSSKSSELQNRRTVQACIETIVLEERPFEFAVLKTLLQNLDHISYSNCEEERYLAQICGSPLCCQLPDQNIKQRFVIKKSGIFDVERRKWFCSDACFYNSQFIMQQLPTAPLWLTGKRLPFEILPPPANALSGMPEVAGEAVWTREDLSVKLPNLTVSSERSIVPNVWTPSVGLHNAKHKDRRGYDHLVLVDGESSDESEEEMDPLDLPESSRADYRPVRHGEIEENDNGFEDGVDCFEFGGGGDQEEEDVDKVASALKDMLVCYGKKVGDIESKIIGNVAGKPNDQTTNGDSVSTGGLSPLDKIRQKHFMNSPSGHLVGRRTKIQQIEAPAWKDLGIIPRIRNLGIVEHPGSNIRTTAGPERMDVDGSVGNNLTRNGGKSTLSAEKGRVKILVNQDCAIEETVRLLSQWVTRESVEWLNSGQADRPSTGSLPESEGSPIICDDPSVDSFEIQSTGISNDCSTSDFASNVANFIKEQSVVNSSKMKEAFGGTSETSFTLPLVDSLDQNCQREMIVVERLAPFWDEILDAIGFVDLDGAFQSQLRKLIAKFRLTPKNISISRRYQWKMLAMCLMICVSQTMESLSLALDSDQSKEALPEILTVDPVLLIEAVRKLLNSIYGSRN